MLSLPPIRNNSGGEGGGEGRGAYARMQDVQTVHTGKKEEETRKWVLLGTANAARRVELPTLRELQDIHLKFPGFFEYSLANGSKKH